jgi:hypothetical protein
MAAIQAFLWWGVEGDKCTEMLVALRWIMALCVLLVSSFVMIMTDLDGKWIDKLRAKVATHDEQVHQANLYRI